MAHQDPLIRYMTLHAHLDEFHVIRNTETGDGEPDSDLQAARYALTGWNPTNSGIAGILTAPNLVGDADCDLPSIRRDYDSVIGFSRRCPVRCEMTYFPNPNMTRTLSKKLHIVHQTYIGGQMVDVVPSSMPNILFAFFGLRHAVRLFFPHLQSNARHPNNRLTPEERAQLYDLAIRPTAVSELSEVVHNWPASFATAVTKDRNGRSGFSNSSYLIAADDIDSFCASMRNTIEAHGDLLWASDFFWGIELRGTKDGTWHSMDCHLDERRQSIEKLLSDVNYEEVNSTWYVDVALENRSHDKALLWSTDAMARVVQEALQISEEDAYRVVRNKRKFSKDVSTHILALSGWRAAWDEEPDGYLGPYEAVCGQAYTTDKVQTYHPEAGHFGKTLTPRLAVRTSPSQWCQNILNIYTDAATTTDVAARLEIRVPLRFALVCLTAFSQNIIRTSLVSYPRQLWWNYRASKLLSGTLVLSSFASESLQAKMLPSTLSLIAGIVHQMNANHSRPDDGSAGRTVQKTVYPLTRDPQHTHILVPTRDLERLEHAYPAGYPYAPGGVLYLRDFTLPPNSTRIRFIDAETLPISVHRHIFGCHTADIRRLVFHAGDGRHVPGPGYVRQCKGTTKPRAPQQNEVLPDYLRNKEGLNVYIQGDEPGVLAMEDAPEDAPEEEADQDGRHTPVDSFHLGEMLDKVLQQFASDIMQKVGNPKVDNAVPHKLPFESYSPLSQKERQALSLADISTLNLTNLFNQVQYRRASEEEWVLAVSRLWPQSEYTPGRSMVHFPRCRYYEDFQNILKQIPNKEEREKVQTQVRQEMWKLPWIPSTRSDKLWDTNATCNTWRRLPHLEAGGPRIFINPRVGGIPTIATERAEEDEQAHREESAVVQEEQDAIAVAVDAARMALREEEEESSSEESIAPQVEESFPESSGTPAARGSDRLSTPRFAARLPVARGKPFRGLQASGHLALVGSGQSPAWKQWTRSIRSPATPAREHTLRLGSAIPEEAPEFEPGWSEMQGWTNEEMEEEKLEIKKEDIGMKVERLQTKDSWEVIEIHSDDSESVTKPIYRDPNVIELTDSESDGDVEMNSNTCELRDHGEDIAIKWQEQDSDSDIDMYM